MPAVVTCTSLDETVIGVQPAGTPVVDGLGKALGGPEPGMGGEVNGDEDEPPGWWSFALRIVKDAKRGRLRLVGLLPRRVFVIVVIAVIVAR